MPLRDLTLRVFDTNKIAQAIFVFMAIVLAQIACYMFFPGAMTWDSLDQLHQARLNVYGDWQPPTMAYLWHHLLWISDGPAAMLLFHISMLYLASAFFYLWSLQKRYRWGVLFILIPLLPWVINFEFVIWKDVGLAYSWLLAASIAVLYGDRVKFPIFAAIAVISLFCYGLLVRANSLAGAIFLLPFIVSCIFKKRSLMFFFMILFFTVVVAFFLPKLVNEFLSAESRHPASYVMFDDLVGLQQAGVKVDAAILNADDVLRIGSCEHWRQNKVGAAFCINEAFEKLRIYSYPELKFEWFSVVLNNPRKYLEYRLGAFSTLTRSPFVEPYYISEFRVPMQPYNFDSEMQPASFWSGIIEKYVNTIKVSLPDIFKPYFWLVASLVIAALMKIHLSHTPTPFYMLPLSGCSYVMGYLPITPAGDFRYSYWLCLITTISLIILVVSILSRKNFK